MISQDVIDEIEAAVFVRDLVWLEEIARAHPGHPTTLVAFLIDQGEGGWIGDDAGLLERLGM